MSIAWMNYVWEHSRQTGTALLLLLAIADHANDDGVCWPSVSRLADKARTTPRQAKRLIAALEAAGEIAVDRGTGAGHTSHYCIKGDIQGPKKGDICDQKGDIQRAKGDIYANEKSDIYDQKGDISGERVTSSAQKGDIAMSPDPSVTITDPSLEPSVDSDANASAQPAAAPPAPPSLTDVFRQFQDELKTTTNRVAVLHRAYVHCYGDQAAPDHGRIAAFAKRVGSWGQALDLLWSTISRPPNGDILAYLEAAHAARKQDRAQPRAAPDPRAFAVSADDAPPCSPDPGPARSPIPPPNGRAQGAGSATLWDKLRWELGKNLPADQFERLVAADLHEYSGDVYELRLPPDSPWLDWARNQAEPMLRRTLSSLLGRRIAISVTLADAPAAVEVHT